jgi:hypothetical protein
VRSSRCRRCWPGGWRCRTPAADLDHRVGARARTAEQGAQPGGDLCRFGRLDQVIICPRVKARDAIIEPAARGQHQHRQGKAGGAAALQPGAAIAVGQAQIEQQGIKSRQVERGLCAIEAGGVVTHDPAAASASASSPASRTLSSTISTRMIAVFNLQSAAMPCICNNSLLERKRMGPSRPGDISHGGYDHFLTIGLRSL